MFEVLINILPVFAAIMVTLWCRYKGWLPDNFSEVVSFVAFRIVVPVLLFQVLSRADFGGGSVSLILFTLALMGVLFVGGWVLSILMGDNNGQKGVLRFSQLDFYVYGFGMPFILANFDQEVISRIVVMDIVMFLGYLILGGTIASMYSNKVVRAWETVKENTVQSLIFWSIIVSLAVNLLRVPIPERVFEMTNYFSGSFSLLVALLIGSSLSLPNLSQLRIHLAAYFSRISLVAMLIFVATSLFAFSQVEQTAMWLTFTVPVGSLGIIFATRYNNDKNFMAQLHLTTFAVALVLYPVLIGWIKGW